MGIDPCGDQSMTSWKRRERLDCTSDMGRAGIELTARRVLLALVLATGTVLISPNSVLAAMDAQLSSSYGRVGDEIRLTTDDNGGRADYSGLSSIGPEPIYLYPAGLDPPSGQCGAGSAVQVGILTWSHGQGTLAFHIPPVAFGNYFLLMQVENQCWRVAGQLPSHVHGPLILSVGDIPAPITSASAPTSPVVPTPSGHGQQSEPSQAGQFGPLALALGAALVIVTLVAATLVFRR